MVTILVCGGRGFGEVPVDCLPDQIAAERARATREVALLTKALDRETARFSRLSVLSGGARGADRHAIAWAKKRGIRHIEMKADWKTYGRFAGPIRNQRMIDEGKPDVVIAFPGGRGTADMIRRAEDNGIPVIRVRDGE